MKQTKNNTLRHCMQHAALWPTAVLGVGLTVPAQVAHAAIADPTEIVVTARRTEELLQNVPISMTVFTQETLDQHNITNVSDLSTYTPSLSVDTRYGGDAAAFAIRGFTQDLGTSPSVAVYFADVVGPRAGGGQINGGNGAGPGAMFDLQNVQVLKGPQGTLFGRNTTGGAIQLTPQEPTTKLEGYLEGSVGNYNMSREQGVINVPILDNVRARFGFDTMKRDGYVENISGVGPDRFNDVDYRAIRASVIWDVTSAVQNYTIFSHSFSENNGTVQGLTNCNVPVGLSFMCTATAAAQGNSFYKVSSGDVSDPISRIRQWQAINTTTWNINDDLTFKNILSYADFTQDLNTSVFGGNLSGSINVPSRPVGGGLVTAPFTLAIPHLDLFLSHAYPGLHIADQSTIVEEMRLAGTALDSKLTWQAGYYYEDSRPKDWVGTESPSMIACDHSTLGTNPLDWSCWSPLGGQGSVATNQYKQEFNNQALYGQGTYDINDEWSATLGLRYTVDNTHADYDRVTYTGFPSAGPAGFIPPNQIVIAPLPAGGPATAFCGTSGQTVPVTSQTQNPNCMVHSSQRSEAPTWLIETDYKPTPDLMAYAKYSRGYRQGSILPAAPPGLDTFNPEKVDAYEIGTKTSFHGPIPGTFNVAVFYNELKDQQLQNGFVPAPGFAGTGTTAIVNAGSSTIQGVEVETTLKLLDDLSFNLGYTYLDTNLDSYTAPTTPVGWADNGGSTPGHDLTFSPRHTVVTGLSYRLPLPAEVGDITAGATYSMTSSQWATHGSELGLLGARQLLNLNVGWKGIYGSPFDASFFMTNALNEEYHVFVAGLNDHLGMEFANTGEPKMWGGRIKYNF